MDIDPSTTPDSVERPLFRCQSDIWKSPRLPLGARTDRCWYSRIYHLAKNPLLGPLVAEARPDAISVKVDLIELSESYASRESFSGLATPRRTSTLGFQSGGTD